MAKLYWAVFLLIALAPACSDSQRTGVDQCLRMELFGSCMRSLPDGPDSTHYSDWDDVVSACERVAYWQSLRRLTQIKPECLP